MRARTTLAATAIMGLALTVGAIGLVAILRRSLTAGVDDALRLRAGVVASLVAKGAPPDPLPASNDETSFVQVVDRSGSVVAASGNIEGEPPVVPLSQSVQGVSIRTVSHMPVGDEGHVRLLMRSVGAPAGVVRIYAGTSLVAAEHSVAVVAAALALGTPALLLVVAATTWAMVGRALSPVEAIRAEVAEISMLALNRQIPEPAVADEIGRLARTMNEMLERLRASTRRQRQFVSDASHELRSPMATIRAQLEVALSHPEIADWPTTGSEVLKEVERLQRLAGQLLVLARADEAGLASGADGVDLDELVLREARQARERGGPVIDVRGVGAARVRGDADQLCQVVRNLVDNAWRHARSQVTLELQTEGTSALLTVADDGPGIPTEDRERVFERFARLDDARAADRGGSGLGLAIAKEIVAGHGGSIAVEDAPAGARLVVRLPSIQGEQLDSPLPVDSR